MSVRVAIGFLLIVGAYLWSAPEALQLIAHVAQIPPDAIDEVTRYERRFEEAKGKLSPREVVGYRADAPSKVGEQQLFVYTIDGADYAMHPRKSFFLAQYALAPVIVDSSEEHRLVIENRRRGVRLAESE